MNISVTSAEGRVDRNERLFVEFGNALSDVQGMLVSAFFYLEIAE